MSKRGGRAQHGEGVRPSLDHQVGTMALLCPFCAGGPILVADSRKSKGAHVRRVRVCRACRKRWTTFEITAAEMTELKRLRAVMKAMQSAFAEASDADV